jgi:hypothetical protein
MMVVLGQLEQLLNGMMVGGLVICLMGYIRTMLVEQLVLELVKYILMFFNDNLWFHG